MTDAPLEDAMTDPQPLSPKEEAALRSALAAGSVDTEHLEPIVPQLLATLDAERMEHEETREALNTAREAAARATSVAPDLRAAAERLRDAISGERRDWHRVEVSPDDIAALLGSQPSRDALTLDVERVEAAIQSAYDAHDDHRTRHPGHAGECQSDWPVPSRLAPLVLARLTAAEESRDA